MGTRCLENFGEVRGLLAEPLTHSTRGWKERLLTHLQRAQITDAERYEAQWHPYLRDHLSTHDVEFEAKSLNHLARLATLLPDNAQIALHMRINRRDDAREYASAAQLDRVTHLHLHGGPNFDSTLFDTLLDSPLSTRLRKLSLYRIDANALFAPSLANMCKIEHLAMHHIRLNAQSIARFDTLESMCELRSLHLDHVRIHAALFKALLDSALFAHLHTLESSHSIHLENLSILAHHAAFSSIESLALTSNRVDTRQLTRFFNSPHLDHLRAFSLALRGRARGKAGARAARALAARPPGIERLELDQVGFAKGYENLASSDALSTCTHLTICEVDSPAVMRSSLAQNEALSNLQHLCLAHVSLDHEEKVEELLAESSFTRLHTLKLSSNDMDPLAAEALFTGLARFPLLHTLHLEDHKRFGDGGALALAEASSLPPLSNLSLSRTQISNTGAEALARCIHLTNLCELDLTECNIEERGVLALTTSPWLARVDRLLIDVVRTKRSDDEVTRALIMSGMTRGLERVTARRGPLTEDTFKALLDTPEMAGAFELDLSRAALDHTLLEALFASPSLAGVHTLDLDMTPITLEMAHLIAASPHLAQISSLSLKQTSLSDEALCVILESPYLRHLTHLNIQGNTFGRPAVEALVACEALRTLDSLFLDHQQLPEGCVLLLALSTNLPNPLRSRWTFD